MNRTLNSTRNIFYGIIEKIINIFLPFVVRSIFIQKLGIEYLGVHSLYTSILQALNLTELGFSNAIIYNLYKPIAANDKSKICALLNLYKKTYRIIGIIILAAGMAILPFLNKIIKGEIPQNLNIYLLYVIYLIGTVITYFLYAYKTALLTAFQRKDITSKVNLLIILVKNTAFIIILFVYKNIYLYAMVNFITAIMYNLICSKIADKKYPEYIAKGKIDNKSTKRIKKNVVGIMLLKTCSTTRNSLDSIFISKFIGITTVGIYNNYFLIISALSSIISVIGDSITASIGNSIVTENIEKNYCDMNKYNFIFMWFSSWCTVTLLCLYQPFMKIWLGEKYMFNNIIVILLVLYFYICCAGHIRYVYSTAIGLWWEERYIMIAQIISNIVLNFIFGKIFGVAGFIIATICSMLFIEFVWSAVILYNNYFKKYKIKDYLKWQGFYLCITIIVAYITYYVCTYFDFFNGIINIFIKTIICIIIPNILFFIFYNRTTYYKQAKKFVVKNIIKLKEKIV